MIFTRLTTAALVATSVFAVPVEEVNLKRAAPSDTDILQYALTLEHLEDNFYSGAIAQFDDNAFANAGYPSWVRDRFQQIADHEATHVAFLSTALGDAATKACNYSFPYTDPQSFVALAAVLESVGSSAYTGAARFITNPAYLEAAASILTTETRHTAWIESAVMANAAWSGAFGTPLDLDQVYSLAAGFITSCPSTNPTLPVRAFPALTTTTSNPSPGSAVTFSFNNTMSGNTTLYAAFLSGLDTEFVMLDSSMSAAIPQDLIGVFYAVISTNNTAVSDDSTVAGPLRFEFRLPETARQTGM